jgi:C4-dicarboxylate transporter DctM subunit
VLLLIVLLVVLVVFFFTGGTLETLFGGPGRLALVLSVSLLLFLGAGVYVGAALGGVAVLLGVLFYARPFYNIFGTVAWGTTANFIFVAAPLFILMGNILMKSGVTDRLYKNLSAWVSFLPGGLLHTNIMASSLFASVSGSSMATAATIGSMALPYFKKGRYNERLVLGSLAAGGTLGILIPPSMKMIWYALLTENSIGRLFVAGIIPGVTLTLLFMAAIAIMSVIWPNVAPKEPASTWRERLTGLGAVLPILSLMLVILGGIYLGLATPTEAAALGVVLSLALALLYRRLTLQMLKEAVDGAARITAMVALILIFADLFDFIVGALGLPTAIATAVAGLDLSPYLILFVIVIFYVVAGTFLDDVALTFATIPVVYPVIKNLAADYPGIGIFDGVAFGILFVVLMEMAIISPPDGINLYVIHGLRKSGSMGDLFVGVTPFIACMGLLIVLLVMFPQLALWLPSIAFGNSAAP